LFRNRLCGRVNWRLNWTPRPSKECPGCAPTVIRCRRQSDWTAATVARHKLSLALILWIGCWYMWRAGC